MKSRQIDSSKFASRLKVESMNILKEEEVENSKRSLLKLLIYKIEDSSINMEAFCGEIEK